MLSGQCQSVLADMTPCAPPMPSTLSNSASITISSDASGECGQCLPPCTLLSTLHTLITAIIPLQRQSPTASPPGLLSSSSFVSRPWRKSMFSMSHLRSCSQIVLLLFCVSLHHATAKIFDGLFALENTRYVLSDGASGSKAVDQRLASGPIVPSSARRRYLVSLALSR